MGFKKKKNESERRACAWSGKVRNRSYLQPIFTHEMWMKEGMIPCANCGGNLLLSGTIFHPQLFTGSCTPLVHALTTCGLESV